MNVDATNLEVGNNVAMNDRPSAADPNRHQLTITRVFDAPRELVFDAWTDPDQLAQWMGPTGFTAPSVTTNLTPGGLWRFCIRNPSSGAEFWSQGTYREIIRPERLVFTFAWEEDGEPGPETVIVIDFAEMGGKTEMTFRQGPFTSAEDRDSHRSGWSEALDDLGIYLARR